MMARCQNTQDFNGVVLQCTEDDTEPHIHEVACSTCAGQVPDVFPEPGMRCIKHQVPEPQP